MKNNLYIKQESKTKQQIFGAHIVRLTERESGGDREKTQFFF